MKLGSGLLIGLLLCPCTAIYSFHNQTCLWSRFYIFPSVCITTQHILKFTAYQLGIFCILFKITLVTLILNVQ